MRSLRKEMRRSAKKNNKIERGKFEQAKINLNKN